jgi:hypothetical protein
MTGGPGEDPPVTARQTGSSAPAGTAKQAPSHRVRTARINVDLLYPFNTVYSLQKNVGLRYNSVTVIVTTHRKEHLMGIAMTMYDNSYEGVHDARA